MSGTGYEAGFKQGLADKQREEYHQGYKEAYHGAEGELGEKAKEAVGLDNRDQGYEQGYSQSSTGYDQGRTGTSSYGQSGGLQQQQRRERTGSSSSSSDEETRAARGGGESRTHRKKGLGEKLKETVGLDPKDSRDPKDTGNQSGTGLVGNQDSSTTGYSSSISGYNQGSSAIGTGTGYNTGASGYGNQGSSGYDQTTSGNGQQGVGSSTSYGQQQQGGTTDYEQASSYGQQQQAGGYGGGQGVTGSDTYRQDEGLAVGDERTHQKKPLKEKLKEKLGLEPKHTASDTQQTSTTERAEYY